MNESTAVQRVESSGGGGWLINHMPAILWQRRWYVIVSFVLLFLIGLVTVPRFGRIRMQVIGFLLMAAAMGILILAVHMAGEATGKTAAIFAAFVLFNLAMNAGPNATTFAMASALFPTGLRASANGFAAAVAKLGATLSVFLLPIIKADFGIPAVLVLMAAVSMVGAASTVILDAAVDDRELP